MVPILYPLVLLIAGLLMIGSVEHWWNDAGRREQVFTEVQLCPQQISRGLTRDRTLSSAVRGGLEARTTARTVEV